VISGRRDPDVWPISCCPAVKERARQRAATGSAFGRSTEGAESSRHRQLLPSQKTVGCSPEKNRRCPKSQMGKGEEAESQLERTRIGEALSATPGSLKKRHHSKSRVSHHTVHLSVMDGAVGMTASQSQASAKRIPLSGAFCSILRIKTASACKPEKRKALAARAHSPLAQRRWSSALLQTFRSFQPAVWGSAMQRFHGCEELLNSPSFASILSGFPSRVPISWLFPVDWEKLVAQPTTCSAVLCRRHRCDLCLYR